MDKVLTPQQELFLSYYTNPKSDTFSNATRSAVKAGYSQDYADNITALMPDWLLENIGDMKRLRKAEKNLDEVQNLQIINEEGKVDVGIVEKRTKVDMFLAERLGKEKYGNNSKLDVTSGGKPIFQIIQYGEENNNDSVQLPAETISADISQEQSEIQNSGNPQERGQEQNSSQPTNTENPA